MHDVIVPTHIFSCYVFIKGYEVRKKNKQKRKKTTNLYIKITTIMKSN